MDKYQELIDAIIIQAVKDYRKALHKLKKQPKNIDAKYLKGDCERFFRSTWYKTITSLDGELIIQKIRQEMC